MSPTKLSGEFYERLILKLQRVVETEQRLSPAHRRKLDEVCDILDQWALRYTLDRVIEP